MLSPTILEALNKQMQHENTNCQIYRNFSGIADYQSLIGTTKWFYLQSVEERLHFELIADYIQDQGHIPQLLSIPEQSMQTLTLYDMFVKTVETEKGTTASLKLISQLCKEENDDQTYLLIIEMLKEQIQEEKTATDILNRIKLAGTGLGFVIIDQELSERQ